MKTALFLAAVVLPAFNCALADILAQWSFNSPVPDGLTSTGSKAPAIGSGVAAYVGGVGAASSGEFAAGDTHHDPAGSSDNSAWNTSKYPAATANNKSAGVRFDVSTVGYENITLTWSQQNSSTASRYARLQYTLDGNAFLDADLITISTESVFSPLTVNLGALPGVSNNPAFGFRIVAEFEASALGAGTNAYVATKAGSAYSTGGTIRFDVVTVSGTLIPGANSAPNIAGPSDLTMRVSQSTDPLPITIWDAEDAPAALALAVASSDPAVIAENHIVLGGSGGNRAATITAGTQPGTATITLYVIDTGGRSNHVSFVVTVLPANTAPSISTLSATNTLAGLPTPPLPFAVNDLESPPGSLAVSGHSANPALVPNSPANISFSGNGTDRTVTLTPAPGQTGVAPITLTVSDGTNTAESTFALLVSPAASVVFYDPFTYPNGSLLTNSGFLWDNRSGTYGQCQVTNGQLQLCSDQSEDVLARLVGGPYAKSNGIVLYASFKFSFLTPPKVTPGYFAHFADGSYLRGRVYAGTSNALAGCFHLWVANGSDTVAPLTVNLSPNTTYTVVTRYDLDSASTTLWLNPAAETEPGVTATDSQTAVPIASYAFRQADDLGATVLIDDLRVGLSFAAVVPAAVVNPLPLTFQRNGPNLILRWTNSACALQAAPFVLGTYTNIPGAANPFTTSLAGPPRFFRLKAN